MCSKPSILGRYDGESYRISALTKGNTRRKQNSEFGIIATIARILRRAHLPVVAVPSEVNPLISGNDPTSKSDADTWPNGCFHRVGGIGAVPAEAVPVGTYSSAVIKASVDSRIDAIQPTATVSSAQVKPNSLPIACKYKEQKKKCFHVDSVDGQQETYN